MGMDIYQYGITEGKIDYTTQLPAPSSSTGTFSVRWPPAAARRKLSPANQSSSGGANSREFPDMKYEISSLDILARSQADFMNKLLEKTENSQADNEERMLRLLADNNKVNHAEATCRE